MKKLKNRYIIIGIIVLLGLGFIYSKFVGPTKVAFINFRDFQYAAILEAKDNPLIKVARITLKEDEAPNLDKYCAIYLFGMGLRLDEGQAAGIKTAIEKGVKVYAYAATSSESDLTNLTGIDLKYIEGYFGNGGKKNLNRLLNYTRRVFDKKVFFSQKIKEPQIIPHDIFFHLGEDDYFAGYRQYQDFYEEKGYFKQAGPKVCLVTTNIGPRNANREHVDMIIKDLEQKGINVYPMSGFLKRLEFIKAVDPSLVVLMPHGRFVPGRADEAVRYLREKNIPLLCPINVFGPYNEWIKDQRGMSGGMMSQSIVMPELDGGIAPYVISAQFKDKNGLYIFKGLANRIETFCRLIENSLKLKSKPNEEKKIAIYYFKGPGLNSMVAGGMEVAPSLLNLLRHLEREGFDTGVLPENEKELIRIIQRQGPVLGVYAKGTFQKYLEEGSPELIDTEAYLEWCEKDLEQEMFEDILENYGPVPGEYMRVEKDGKTYIAVARIRFNNVVILPQPLPGYGNNQSQLIHGAKKAPPHSYVASYLWVRNGFGADAIIHFGTHGSLEFTPWKQVALSEYDWPDALIAGMPHIYVYVINNIGEAVIAKRRSYAVITSHLTPPFTESDLYGALSDLHNKFHNYIKTEDEALRNEYRKSIKKAVIKLGLHKDLGLEDFENKKLTKGVFDKLHNHIHTLEQEKITRGLYTLGESYEDEHIYETAKLMAIDSLSYSAARLDLLKGRITDKKINDAHYFDEVYRQKAVRIIDNILLKENSAESFLDKDDAERLEQWDKSHQTMTDDEFFASMVSLAQSDKPKNDTGPKEKTGLDSEKLKRLILKVAPYEKKKELLLSLQDENRFRKMSALLDPQSLKKAMKIAKVVPAMKEAIELAVDNDVRELLVIMRDETIRKQVFRYLKDKKMREAIKEEQKKLKQQIIWKCLNEAYWQDLFMAIDRDRIKNNIGKRDKSGLLDFKEHLKFYLKAAKLADDIAFVKS
ncbi:MAG: cobaltochelatase subunit CobN, partial [Candidatus Omnitrophota bacterium]|nr:cobaltochelatase subunit CobN [Candidatus Omnitrophota bacterium]